MFLCCAGDEKEMKLSEAIILFLKEQKARGNTEKTIKIYERNLSYFVDFSKDIDVAAITKSTVIDYMVYLREKPKNFGHKYKKINSTEKLSSVTVQSYIRHLKCFIAWLYENEYVEIDLSKKLKLPKAFKGIKRILTDDEISKIFKACEYTNESVRNKLILSLMLHSGLRANEVVKLKWDDFIPKENLLTVTGKGQKERIVPIGNFTLNLLKNYKEELIFYRCKNLFLTKQLKPITYSTINSMIKRIAKSSGVKRLHAHLLRHTFATRYLVKTKGDIVSLQAIMGHTTVKMCQHYLHLATEYSIGQYREFLN